MPRRLSAVGPPGVTPATPLEELDDRRGGVAASSLACCRLLRARRFCQRFVDQRETRTGKDPNAAEHQAAAPGQRLSGLQLHPREPLEQHVGRNLPFESRKGSAETVVDPVPERETPVRCLTRPHHPHHFYPRRPQKRPPGARKRLRGPRKQLPRHRLELPRHHREVPRGRKLAPGIIRKPPGIISMCAGAVSRTSSSTAKPPATT